MRRSFVNFYFLAESALIALSFSIFYKFLYNSPFNIIIFLISTATLYSYILMKNYLMRKRKVNNKIDISKLLNRKKVDVCLNDFSNKIRNKIVLVTGAGGSIGSELCRQILSFQPRLLIMLDNSEYNLFQIDNELREKYIHKFKSLLIDIKNYNDTNHIISKYNPEMIFHAAAYKHVHLVQENPFPSILNNILSTRNILNSCIQNNTPNFVLISTDKAVNPSNIMGMSKRICELMVMDIGRRHNKKYCSVRFGNVIGSSGSLVPLLMNQILNEKPITITDSRMERYFMSIEEACSLVLKASTISRPGDINILKMGKSIKIIELIDRLIVMLGKDPGKITKKYIGIRPGEKLKEELYLKGNEIQTEHNDILIIPHKFRSNTQESYLLYYVEEIIQLSRRRDKRTVEKLKTLINNETLMFTPPLEDNQRGINI